MEVLVYLAMLVLAAPYVLMAFAAIKLHSKRLKNQGESSLDLTESA